MFTIGLVGGVASGKSLVAQMLADRGAVVLSADQVAHDVLGLPEVRDALVARWGRGVLNSQGEIDRPAVARRVFGPGPQELAERKFLEAIVHPPTRQRMEVELAAHAADGADVCVVDAPLLLEAGWNELCNLVVLVDTPRARREVFASQRGWKPDEIARREAAQMPMEQKRRAADYVIENSADLAALREQVAMFWSEMVERRSV